MTRIDGFRDSRGVFCMVAVDQRESLRGMLAAARRVPEVADQDLVEFKHAVSAALTGSASGILLDPQFGESAAAAADCAVVMAADVLSSSQPGGPVDTAVLDRTVTAATAESMNARALKMLVPWLPERRDEAIMLTEEFLELCRALDLPSIVEGVVRPVDVADWALERRAEGVIAAAADLAPLGADLYKAEMVYTAASDHELAVRTARAISEVTPCPWVLLSSGIPAALFEDALSAACEGGAEGFLAGRAIWSSAVGATDVEDHLRTTSTSILRNLADTARRSIHA